MIGMLKSVNAVVLSGVVRNIFEEGKTKSDLKTQSFVLAYYEGEHERRIVAKAFGDNLVEVIGELDVDTPVIVQGRISEQNWQDKETEEWKKRHDVVISNLVVLNTDEDGPFGD